jgi:hypothetical protein
MKTQLEVFLTSVHIRMLQLPSTPNKSPPSSSLSLLAPRQSNPLELATARQELVLESLLEFCREPGEYEFQIKTIHYSSLHTSHHILTLSFYL